MPGFKKSLIVDQFQGNYLKNPVFFLLIIRKSRGQFMKIKHDKPSILHACLEQLLLLSIDDFL